MLNKMVGLVTTAAPERATAVQDAHGIWTAPNGDQVAWFRDPDGNTLSLSCHRCRA